MDTDDVMAGSGNVKVQAPWGNQVPVAVQITLSGRVGSGNIIARPARRSFWEWLMRRPRRYAVASGA